MKSHRKSSPPESRRLFPESHSAPPAGVYIANIDGGSRGNPGPAAYAAVIRDPSGKKTAEISKCMGITTNNVAEYFGLIAALDYATAHNIRALRIRSDSELLVRQMRGEYKVKSAELKPLHERARKMAAGLQYFVIEHVPREQNREADALLNAELDRARVVAQPSARSTLYTSEHPQRQRIRARYSGGVFIPESPTGLPEGSAVELEIRKPNES